LFVFLVSHHPRLTCLPRHSHHQRTAKAKLKKEEKTPQKKNPRILGQFAQGCQEAKSQKKSFWEADLPPTPYSHTKGGK
jgi:endonuclease YncB( thermonuclease family)